MGDLLSPAHLIILLIIIAGIWLVAGARRVGRRRGSASREADVRAELEAERIRRRGGDG